MREVYEEVNQGPKEDETKNVYFKVNKENSYHCCQACIKRTQQGWTS